MRGGNVFLVVVCVAAIGAALMMSWSWRALPVVASRVPRVTTAKESALDAVRTLACVMTAGFVSGALVVGFGGRLVMRILAATSGDGAQGRVTDAGEAVGEISLGGSVSFFIFAGLLLPVAASFLFIPLRRLFTASAWTAGVVFGVILLGLFGVDDPLSPDNVDFLILSPLWLAVTLVSATALLFGVTFAAITARLDATLPAPTRMRSDARWRDRSAYASLVGLLMPVFAVLAAAYVGVRAVSHGRLGLGLQGSAWRHAGHAVAGILTLAATGAIIGAAVDIL